MYIYIPINGILLAYFSLIQREMMDETKYTKYLEVVPKEVGMKRFCGITSTQIPMMFFFLRIYFWLISFPGRSLFVISSKNIPPRVFSTRCGQCTRSDGIISRRRRLAPGATYRNSLSPKRSAVQTPRNTNTAQSFLWGSGSSKSVPDSPADPAPLSRWGTPLIKATDCTLC